MKNTLRFGAASLITSLALFAGCAHEQTTSTPPVTAVAATAAPAKAAHFYIAPDAVDYKELLPAPSGKQSAISKGEGDLLLAIRAEVSKEAIERMKREDAFSVWTYADVMGPEFTAERYPLTAALVKRVHKDADVITAAAKEHWKRERPFVQDSRVEPLLKATQTSYPSGHATRAIVDARVIGELVPAKAGVLRERARLVALDRVIAGVHYPTDVAAGMALGDAVMDKIDQSEAYQKDVEAAKAEWK